MAIKDKLTRFLPGRQENVIYSRMNSMLTEIENNVDSEIGQKLDKSGGVMAGKLEVPEMELWGKKLIELYTQALFIDEVNGDDSNDGRTAQTAVKTTTRLARLIPNFINNNLTINIIGNLTTTLFINNVTTAYVESQRVLTIKGYTGDKNNHNVYGLRCSNISSVIVQNLKFGVNALGIDNCNFIVDNCETSNPTVSGSTAIFVSRASGRIQNCVINSTTGNALYINEGSTVQCSNCVGTNTRYIVVNGGICIKSGTQPTGQEIISDLGGSIFERNIGGIHSRGSNANGEWIRFEDGTQLCYRTESITSDKIRIGCGVGGTATWTFPSSFINTDIVMMASGIRNTTSGGDLAASDYAMVRCFSYNINVGIAVLEFNSTQNSTKRIHVQAIGRWK